MAQQLRPLTVLLDDPGSIPSNHMGSTQLSVTLVPRDTTSSHRQGMGDIRAHKIKINLKNKLLLKKNYRAEKTIQFS